MPHSLRVTLGQYSDKGRKDSNQDCYGAIIPLEPVLSRKGIAVALADGISSSKVGRIASESATKEFLNDYYCTSDAWSVRSSAYRVIAATNSWLHAQTRRSGHAVDRDRGYVCTFSAMILKSTTAHLFHIGDARIFRLIGETLEQLTVDHRVVLSAEQSYLGRALGMNAQIEIDYRTLPLAVGDVFLLATDGVYEHVSPRLIAAHIAEAADLDTAAQAIVADAFANGSPDNLTVQILRIDQLPDGAADEAVDEARHLPPPPLLDAPATFEAYRVLRVLHASSRSHLYLATEPDSDRLVVLKFPSLDLRADPAYLKRFAMEDWVARRLRSPHIAKPAGETRRRRFLYNVSEFIDGITLRQWILNQPRPDLDTVRGIVEQIAAGLRAFHRKEMLHQDLRPENIMIDKTGTVKIIDFGSTFIKGVHESGPAATAQTEILGTAQYTAPEYFLGMGGTASSDLYALAVITYEMLCGRLPYDLRLIHARTSGAQRKIAYESISRHRPDLPVRLDAVLQKALNIDPEARYGELSAFLYDLRHFNAVSFTIGAAPLIERNPALLWKITAVILLFLNLLQLIIDRSFGR